MVFSRFSSSSSQFCYSYQFFCCILIFTMITRLRLSCYEPAFYVLHEYHVNELGLSTFVCEDDCLRKVEYV